MISGDELPKAYRSWDDIYSAVQIIKTMLEGSGFKPDAIVGIRRGGVIPAALLAGMCNCRFIDVEAGVFDVAHFTGNVLIVDDISDTGATFLALIKSSGFDSTRMRTACVIQNKGSKFISTYFGSMIDKRKDNCWIVFPWEDDWGEET